jgi:hypothetical protein
LPRLLHVVESLELLEVQPVQHDRTPHRLPESAQDALICMETFALMAFAKSGGTISTFPYIHNH